MPGIDQATQDVLTRIVERGLSLPPIPEVGMELMTIVRQPMDDIDIGQVAKRVERDAGLTARLLQLANSSFFGVGKKVTTVRHAIALIGLGETLTFLNYHLFTNTIPSFRTIETFSSQQFWAHSWACAIAAKMLGGPQFYTHASPGELYLCGLLHDVGKVALALHRPVEFGESLRLSRERGIPLHMAEREVIGVDHAMVGGHLLMLWHLPKSIADATTFHHNPEEAEPEARELAGLVQFADVVALRTSVGANGAPPRSLSECWIAQQHGSALASVTTHEELIRKLTEELEEKSSLFTRREIEPTPQEKTASDSVLQEPEESRDPAMQPAEGAATTPDANTNAKPTSRWRRLLGGRHSKPIQ